MEQSVCCVSASSVNMVKNKTNNYLVDTTHFELLISNWLPHLIAICFSRVEILLNLIMLNDLFDKYL